MLVRNQEEEHARIAAAGNWNVPAITSYEGVRTNNENYGLSLFWTRFQLIDLGIEATIKYLQSQVERELHRFHDTSGRVRT